MPIQATSSRRIGPEYCENKKKRNVTVVEIHYYYMKDVFSELLAVDEISSESPNINQEQINTTKLMCHISSRTVRQQ